MHKYMSLSEPASKGTSEVREWGDGWRAKERGEGEACLAYVAKEPRLLET